MDGHAHQKKHTHISCGLIFLFASSRGAGRFIWEDGNEGGEAQVSSFCSQYVIHTFLLLDAELLSLFPLTFLYRGDILV